MEKMKRFAAWIVMLAVLLTSFAFAEEDLFMAVYVPAEEEALLIEEADAEEAIEAAEEAVEEELTEEGLPVELEPETELSGPVPMEDHDCRVSCGNPGVCEICGEPNDAEPEHNCWNEETQQYWVMKEDEPWLCGAFCWDCQQWIELYEHHNRCINPGVCDRGCGAVLDGWELSHNWWNEEKQNENWIDLGDGWHIIQCMDCGEETDRGEHWQSCSNPGVCGSCGTALGDDYGIGHESWIDEEQRHNWIVTENGLRAQQCIYCGEIWDEHECWARCGSEGLCAQCGFALGDGYETSHDPWLGEEQRDNWIVTENGLWALQCVYCGEIWDEHCCWARCGNEGVCAQCGNLCDSEPEHDTWNHEEGRPNCFPKEDDPSMHVYCCDGCGEVVDEGRHCVSCDAEDKSVCIDCGASIVGIEYDIGHPIPDWNNRIVDPENPDYCGVLCPVCNQLQAYSEHWQSCSNPGVCQGCGTALGGDYGIGHNSWIEEEQRDNWIVTENGLWALQCLDCGEIWEEHWCWVRCGNEGVCDHCGMPNDAEPQHDTWNREENRPNCYPMEGDPNMHVYFCDGCGEAVEEGWHGVSCSAEDKSVCSDCGVSVEGIEYDNWHDSWIPEEERDNWIVTENGLWAVQCVHCGEIWEEHCCWVRCGEEGVCAQCGNLCDSEPEHDTWNREENRPNCYPMDGDPNMHVYFCDGCGEAVNEGWHGVGCWAEDRSICTDCGASIVGLEVEEWHDVDESGSCRNCGAFIGCPHNFWIEEEQRDNWIITENGQWALQCLNCGEIQEEHDCWVRCGNEGVCDHCGMPCDAAPEHDIWNREENRPNCYPMEGDPNMHVYFCDGCGEAVEEGWHGVSCGAEDKSVCSDCGVSVEGIEYDNWHDSWIPEEERDNWIVTENGLWAVQCVHCGEIWEEHYCWVRCGEEGVCAQCGNLCDSEPEHDTWNHEEDRPNCFPKEDDPSMHVYFCFGCGELVDEGWHGVGCWAEDQSVCSDCGAFVEGMEVEEWHDLGDEWEICYPDPENPGFHGNYCFACDRIVYQSKHFGFCTEPNYCVDCGAECELEEEQTGHRNVNIELTEDESQHIVDCIDCDDLYLVLDHFYVCFLEDRSMCADCGYPGTDFAIEHPGVNDEGWCEMCGEYVGVECAHYAFCTEPGVCAECGEEIEGLDIAHNIDYEAGAKVLPYDSDYCGYPCLDCGAWDNVILHVTLCDAADQTVCANCGTKAANLRYDHYIDPDTRGFDDYGHWYECRKCGASHKEPHQILCNENMECMYGCGQVEHGTIIHVVGGIDWSKAPVHLDGGAHHAWPCSICGGLELMEEHKYVDGVCICGAETEVLSEVRLPNGMTVYVKQPANVSAEIIGAAVKVEYSSSNTKVATVDANGEITAKKAGSVDITVKATGADGTVKSDTMTLTVLAVPTKITLSSKKLTLGVGETAALTAKLSPSKAYDVLSWTSSNTEVVTVYSNGKLNATGEGKATITVETVNGKKASCEVTVLGAPAEIKANVNELMLIVKKTATIKAEAVSAAGGDCAGTLVYESSDPSVATIDAKGKVTAKKNGEAVIAISTYNGLVKEVKIAVFNAPKKVTLDLTKATVNKGETLQLTAAIAEGEYSAFAWSTSAKKVATVDANGLVTTVAEGTATITVKTDNGKKATCKITVVDPKKATGVELELSGTVALAVGQTLQLNATVLPETAETTLSWSSSSKKVAEVDANGVVTAVKKGTATITVKTANGKKDTVKIKVV